MGFFIGGKTHMILEAVFSFIGTNIDNIFILVALYTAAGSSYSKKDIVRGQMVGIAILVLISYIVSLGAKVFPTEFLSLLGLIPIFMGVREAMGLLRHREENPSVAGDVKTVKSENGFLKMMITAVACGSDNIGVYIPLFTKLIGFDIIVYVIVFVVLTPCLCFFASKISRIPTLHKKMLRYQDILVPLVFILLGIYILLK